MLDQTRTRRRESEQPTRRTGLDRDALQRVISQVALSGQELSGLRQELEAAYRAGTLDHGDLQAFEEMLAGFATGAEGARGERGAQPLPGQRAPTASDEKAGPAEPSLGGVVGAAAGAATEVVINKVAVIAGPALALVEQIEEKDEVEVAIARPAARKTEQRPKGRTPSSTLSDSGASERFLAGLAPIVGTWAEMWPALRAKWFGDLVNHELKTAEVPECLIQVRPLGDTLNGQFVFPTWSINLNEARIASDKATPAEIRQAGATVFHEARHAEQWYRMAQIDAANGKTADQIVRANGIPQDVAAKAVANPLDLTSSLGQKAQTWYDSVQGKDSGHREQTLTEKREIKAQLVLKKVELEALVASFQALVAQDSPSLEAMKDAERLAESLVAEITALEAREKELYEAYRALPEEVDARAAAHPIKAGLPGVDADD